MICNVNQTDSIIVAKYDSLLADGFHLRYEILREKYQVSLDSTLKGDQNLVETVDSIFTPEFSSSGRREKKEFTGMDSNGDSTFLYTTEYNYSINDDSYFRIKSTEKRVVILRKKEIGYVIDYQTECDSFILNLIQEVNLKGEDYFNLLSSQTIHSGNFQVHPNPFNDVVKIKGIQAERIEITDINGKTMEVKMQDPNNIDLSFLKRGVYVISIFDDKKKWTQKIVKK